MENVDYMKKMITENPCVKTIAPIFGAELGTILRYNANNAKYVSIEQEEDAGENTYFSSDSAIAIDPALAN